MPASTSQRRTKPKVRRNSDVILRQAIDTLMAQDKQLLSTKYRDHQLTGSWRGYREIHIEGDWLVIYRVEKQELQLVLTRTGSHDDLF